MNFFVQCDFMVFNKCKLFCITSLLCSVLIDHSNASTTDISMDFKQDGSCLVKYTTEKVFNNINELSSGLNSITGDYFSVNSMKLDNNNVVFNGICNTKLCNITFSSSDSFKPGVVLNFGDNGANISKLSINRDVSYLDISCDAQEKVKIGNIDIKSVVSTAPNINSEVMKHITVHASSKFTMGGDVETTNQDFEDN